MILLEPCVFGENYTVGVLVRFFCVDFGQLGYYSMLFRGELLLECWPGILCEFWTARLLFYVA